MYAKGPKKGTVKFSLKPKSAVKNISVVGDFNQWTPTSLKKQKDGCYVANVPVNKECFEYKFLVDGQWVVDPDHSQWAMNPYGTPNSLGVLK